MKTLLGILLLASLVGIIVGLIAIVVKKCKKKSVKKSFALAGLSLLVFIVVCTVSPEPPIEQQVGGLELSGTYINANKDRMLVFDGKTACLYENGVQIQAGVYKYHGERSISIIYKDYGELLIYTTDTKEILYQGNGNAVNLGEVEYVKEGIVNVDLTPLDIEYPPNSIHYKSPEIEASTSESP